MPIASTSRHRLSLVKELEYGVTPASPSFQLVRNTDVSLALTKETLQSNEMREDRQISGFKHGNKQVGGDISIDFSYESFDPLLEAALCGTWSKDVLTVGIEQHSFTFERFFTDIGQYHRFTGVQINTLSLSVAPNAMVTGTFGTLGSDMVSDTKVIADATYGDNLITQPFDSFSGSLLVNGKPSNVVTSVELSLENGLEPRFVVGSANTREPSIGNSNISGSMSVFFEDSTMIDQFINEDEVSLKFSLNGQSGGYDFELPRIKFSSGTPEKDGNSYIINMSFQGLPDDNGVNLRITRVPINADVERVSVSTNDFQLEI
ncbi:hypothetical protein AB832_07370 [Flavobacteriaceae bacterium (ex Bugula neritina AB1)]|nr:hypothetical protein AB832_07370 [Flavobacteriaceae bacterium (ex Bugula neritina AB1)]